MKNRFLLAFVAALLLTQACLLPGMAVATPTRHPLPAPPVLPTTPPFALVATASASLPDAPPGLAVDGNLETAWNAGKEPEEWIQVDLGRAATVSASRLVVAQSPDGETVHQVWVGPDPINLTLVHEFRGFTRDAETLEFIPAAPLPDVRIVHVVTAASTSWVAWKEIQITAQ
jgi:hypothetical protein